MSTATARSTTNENIFAINSQHLSRFSTSKYKLKTIIDDVTSSSSLHLDRSIAYSQLIRAITDGNLGLVKETIELGLDVNYIYDREQNYSFLHLACLMGHSKVIMYLLDSGANPNVVTSDGHQPIDFIESDDSNSITYMLLRMNSK